jgi:membrane protein required for colicin V production
MNFFDWILIVLFAAGALWGYKSGLITGALTVASLYAASLISGQFSERVVGLISQNAGVESESIATALAYLIIFGGVLIAGRIVAKLLKTMLSVVLLGWIDKIGGIAFGLLAGFLIVGAVVAFTARLAYPIDSAKLSDLEGDILEQALKQTAVNMGEGFLNDTLVGSEVTNVVVDVYNAVPGESLGMLPGDFAHAFEILNERKTIASE